MDEKSIHDLAVAYAQVKLQHYQDEYRESGDSEDIYQYIKAYRFTLDNIQNAWDEIN